MGGWPQLVNKLLLNDLEYRGNLVPEVKAAIPEAIDDLFRTCVAEGATTLILPKKPVSFTSLIAILKELNLIKTAAPVVSPPSLAPPAASSSAAPPPTPELAFVAPIESIEDSETARLLAQHHTQVSLVSI